MAMHATNKYFYISSSPPPPPVSLLLLFPMAATYFSLNTSPSHSRLPSSPSSPSPLHPSPSPCCFLLARTTSPHNLNVLVCMAAFPGLCIGRALRRSVKSSNSWGLISSARARARVSSAQAVWKQEVLWTEAPVSDIAPAGEQLFHLVVDISGNRELMQGYTKAGQYLQLKVGNSDPAFMSIASPPSAALKGYLEFLIKDVEGVTAGILCDLGKGDKIELSQVLGRGFNVGQIYPVEEFPTVLLFATGTGISPIRALLESGIKAKDRRDVRLYYGARNLQRMAYQDKFQDWENLGVRILPVLSQPDDKWDGEQGYVQVAFSKSKALIKPAHTGVFLCGQKAMTEELTTLLLAEGVRKEKILLNF
ncbi:hypothetical protein O6H91_15G056900 [Diphasiastrum complanatum]|uniref:Uncharacterized protein n=1 Tax=Diphasiastrum complanatum TaxID=34168 RepID=A0ACC2BIL2_DIPCM|nr:hypothetical protein O6H91_15G056900 [Diphasiastrum complanatum]